MNINIKNVKNFVSDAEIKAEIEKAQVANEMLHNKTGLGNDFLGWIDLPSQISNDLLSDIEKTAKELSEKTDIVVTIGIGGSYLGAKAVIEALSHNFSHLQSKRNAPLVLFAGNNIGEDYLTDLREILSEKSYGLIIISKSGTTTEPAVAFRILKNDLEEKYGKKEAQTRIIAVTDKERGALKQLADQEGYKSYVIADDIGGRFSVLTPVGLLPVAVAGFDIKKLVEGAKNMAGETSNNVEPASNPANLYAAVRNILYRKNFNTEILVNYNPKLHFIAEWWKQLYGESEGKDGKGIFPASVDFTADLHSMGQYIQDGRRNLFETVISIENTDHELRLPKDDANLDNLNYLAGKRIDEINKNAELGTVLAHIEGGVPNILLEIPRIDEYHIGELLYFFEKACGVSGYILGVNPFDQPGVEAYKRNMFALLEKPGYEGEKEKLLKK